MLRGRARPKTHADRGLPVPKARAACRVPVPEACGSRPAPGGGTAARARDRATRGAAGRAARGGARDHTHDETDPIAPGRTPLASTSSFDVTTGVDFMEVHNAVDQATKEITQRYDFKGLKVSFALDQKEKKITISAPDEFKLKAMWDVLQGKMVRRQVALKNLTP